MTMTMMIMRKLILKKWKFFKIVLKNYGKSALCLSGGACFAYTHFGIAKALLDQNLLPQIISGTSGGGLIAALLCTRTNEELKKLLVPQLARKSLHVKILGIYGSRDFKNWSKI